VVLKFDFANGETRSATISPSDKLYAKFAGHGALQKIGDETAGEEGVDDMVLAVDAIMKRLAEGSWGTERKAGDGFSGASVVVRALMEATKGSKKYPDGLTQAEAKAFLEEKLAAGKESGLTRQKLYASFKVPGTKTAPIIERLEKEKATTAPAINADEVLNEMMG
jgi:hypothetical protein